MKRSGSRASKVSNDAQDSLENSFPGIPDAKWHEFLEKEDVDLFILGLREEILNKCLEICFDSYLEKQAVSFTVHCAYLAWCKVLNVYYMVRDPGDADDSEEKKSWEPDLEPEYSIIDSWGSQCVLSQRQEEPAKKTEKEWGKEVFKTSSNPPTVCTVESLEYCAFASEFCNEEYFYSPLGLYLSSESLGSKKSSEKCSIETLSITKTGELAHTPCDVKSKGKKKNESCCKKK